MLTLQPQPRALPKRRNQTAIDIPPEQIAWLDAQAAANLCSRSAFVRQLIQRLMVEQGAAS